MATPNKNFSFFINSSPEEIIKKDKDNYLEYILIQNDFLHQKVQNLEKRIQEITEEKNEFETDNENYEKKIISLRGITYNEHEINNLLVKISHANNDLLNKYKMIQNDHDIVLFIMTLATIIFTTLNFLINLNSIMTYLIMLCINLFGLVTYTSLRKEGKTIVLEEKYENMQKQYRKMVKNQDYVSKLIDNV